MSTISFPKNAAIRVLQSAITGGGVQKRYKPHIRKRHGTWVCHIHGDISEHAGRGDSTRAAYMDWLRRARDA
jgi:hypothetical protein